MIKKTLLFQNPASLSLKNEQLVIRLNDVEEIITRPIEDLGAIIIESQQVRYTTPLLNKLADNNVAVIFCDENCMPHSMLMTLEGNSTLQETYRSQIDASLPIKKNAWKQIVESKIKNQSALLSAVGKDSSLLKPFYSNVQSGDPTNREGAAARLYWTELYGNDFKRSRDGECPNNLLNYGYTILRAATARAIISSGLFPAFGLFHKNRYNAFPLADDLMEPYRPFVDQVVYHLYFDGCHEVLDKEVKIHLQNILYTDVRIKDKTSPLQIALSQTSASLVKCLKGDAKSLVLPSLK